MSVSGIDHFRRGGPVKVVPCVGHGGDGVGVEENRRGSQFAGYSMNNFGHKRILGYSSLHLDRVIVFGV